MSQEVARTREKLVELLVELNQSPDNDAESILIEGRFKGQVNFDLITSLENVQTTVSPAAAMLLNSAVRTMHERHIAAISGIWYGYALFAAMQKNPHRVIFGFDVYDSNGRVRAGRAVYRDVMKRFKLFRTPKHFVYEADAVGFFLGEHFTHERYWGQAGMYDFWPVGVFFYDSDQDYDHVLSSLQTADKTLAKGSLVMVNSVSVDGVGTAVDEFVIRQAGKYRILLNKRTYSDVLWGDGLAVLEQL